MSVCVLILSITFDTEGGFTSLSNFLFFHTRHFLGIFGQAPLKVFMFAFGFALDL